MSGQSNIGDVRARIMALESAAVFDQRAWAEVLIAMTDRPCARADAARRMATAKSWQATVQVPVAVETHELPQYDCVNCGKVDADQVVEDEDHPGMGMCKRCTCTVFVRMESWETAQRNSVVGVDWAVGKDFSVVMEIDSKQFRMAKANELLRVIAGCGRKFFSHQGRVSRFELDSRGRVWFIDAYREARIYTHYASGWSRRGFSEGGTLRDLVIRLRIYIQDERDLGRALGPYPDWYSGGDPWGYGADMRIVFDAATKIGMVKEMAGVA
jgi:hypothetical protein